MASRVKLGQDLGNCPTNPPEELSECPRIRDRHHDYPQGDTLSADFFTVPDDQIAHIEAELTVAGGRVVYASDNYQGQAEPLPDITLDWSPVTHYGGYQNYPSGVRQAQCLVEAAADSAEQRAWREALGEHIHDQRPAGGCW